MSEKLSSRTYPFAGAAVVPEPVAGAIDVNHPLPHPDLAHLEAFAWGALDPSAIDDVQQHLADCPACCQTLDGVPDDHLSTLVRHVGSSVHTGETVIAAQDLTADAASIGMPHPECSPAPAIDLPPELAEHTRYHVSELIGKGGMGEVYKAEHRLMQRTVALKVIHRELTQNSQAVERFQREVRAAASLAHGNIVSAYDAEQAGDVHFLAMEYVEGTDLAQIVESQGRLPVPTACDHIRQAALGLQYAHKQGLVHRDIKPHNLMVTSHGTVKILDFGLASLTERKVDEQPVTESGDLTSVGAIMGTPDYISPEQSQDARSADIRSDIYSLGATLFFLLAGRPPFATGTVADKLHSHAEHQAERLDRIRGDVPTELADVIARLLAKDPQARFQTPAEVADALTPFVDRHKSDTGQDLVSVAKPQGSRRRTRPLATVGLTLAGVALLALIAGAVFYAQTNYGWVRVQSDDRNTTFTMDDGTTVNLRDTVKAQFRIPAGSHVLHIEQNELALTTEAFAVGRGEEVVVNVERTDDRLLAHLLRPQDSSGANPVTKFVSTLVGQSSFVPPPDPVARDFPVSLAERALADMQFVMIPGGRFQMGSPRMEKGNPTQQQHPIAISFSFYLGAHEVTQQQYEWVMGSNPSAFAVSGAAASHVKELDTRRFPVENVSWEDAVEFCRRLSQVPSAIEAGHEFRLPTEAEWEYACRANTSTSFHFGDELNGCQANVDGQHPWGTSERGPALERTTEVGSYEASPFGLYDMHGNVWEWCSDWYGLNYYPSSPRTDPTGPETGTNRVVRGGSWSFGGLYARAGSRGQRAPDYRDHDLGLRVVREQVPSTENSSGDSEGKN